MAGCAPTAPSPAGATNERPRLTQRRRRWRPIRGGLRTKFWGWNRRGQAPRGSAVTAGEEHSCGLRTNGTITCWGNNATAPDEQFSAVGGRWPAGQFSAVTAGRSIHTPACGLRTDGTITCWGANTDELGVNYFGEAIAAGRASSPPSPPASAMRAGCAPTAPSPAGDSTPTRWATTTTGRRTRRPGSSPPSDRRHFLFVRAAHRRHHHLLGTQRLRGGADRRAGRAVLRRHRRRRPCVRAAHRLGHHHLLGRQRLRAGDRARRVILRRHRPASARGPLRAAWWRSGSAAVAIACRVAARISPTMWRASGACSMGRPYRAPRALPAASASRPPSPHEYAPRSGASRIGRAPPTGRRSTRRCRWTGRSPRPPPRLPNRGAVNAPPARPTPAGCG